MFPNMTPRAAAHQLVGGTVQIKAEAIPEQVSRHVPELHSDLCAPAGQGLAGLQQKGNAVPSSIVDKQCH